MGTFIEKFYFITQKQSGTVHLTGSFGLLLFYQRKNYALTSSNWLLYKSA